MRMRMRTLKGVEMTGRLYVDDSNYVYTRRIAREAKNTYGGEVLNGPQWYQYGRIIQGKLPVNDEEALAGFTTWTSNPHPLPGRGPYEARLRRLLFEQAL